MSDNPLAYTGIKWVDRDGSEHVWPCESHHGMTIYPAGSELKVETGSDNKLQVTEFTEEPRP